VRKTNKRENKIRKEKKKPVMVHRKSLPEKWLSREKMCETLAFPVSHFHENNTQKEKIGGEWRIIHSLRQPKIGDTTAVSTNNRGRIHIPPRLWLQPQWYPPCKNNSKIFSCLPPRFWKQPWWYLFAIIHY